MFKVFVGNLSFKTTEDQLREIFAPHFTIEDIVIAKDEKTGKPRGFGFVMTKEEDKGRAAVRKLYKVEMDGRLVYLKESTAKKKKGQPGGFQGRPRGPRPGGPGNFSNRPRSPRRGPGGPPMPQRPPLQSRPPAPRPQSPPQAQPSPSPQIPPRPVIQPAPPPTIAGGYTSLEDEKQSNG